MTDFPFTFHIGSQIKSIDFFLHHSLFNLPKSELVCTCAFTVLIGHKQYSSMLLIAQDEKCLVMVELVSTNDVASHPKIVILTKLLEAHSTYVMS